MTVSAQLVNLETMVVGAFLAGVGNGILWVFSSQLLLQLVPKSVRGRVFATEFAFFTLASAAGSAVVGSAIDLPLGMHGLLTTMATLTLVPCLAWSFWLAYRAFWQYDDASVKGESHIAVSSAGPVSDKL